MRVVLSTIGRFHTFDVAAELARRGALAGVFTGYPRFKLRETGVDPRLIRSFPWLQAPWMALTRYPWFRPLRDGWSVAAHVSLDRWTAARLPDCDVVSVMSGTGLATGRAARQRGIAYVCERASSHILEQERLLAEEHDRHGLPWDGIDKRMIARELAEYDEADAILVPSRFVFDSFVARGVAPQRLIHLPFGVAPIPRPAAPEAEFRVLFVGQLSLRKGLPYLLDAFRRAALPGARLVLVGAAQPETEALLRRHGGDGVELTGPLPRDAVMRQMARAAVLVLPSIEEGLALVQAEALACGCPVIGTPNGGAADLFEDGREGFIVPIRDADAIAERLVLLHADPERRRAMSRAALALTARRGGWESYADGLLAAFQRLLAK